MDRFYSDPANEARFLEWKEARKINPATDLRRAPSESRRPAGKQHANHTA